MNGIKWRDTTSRRQGESPNARARAWTCTLGGVRLSIVRHRDNPEVWTLRVHPNIGGLDVSELAERHPSAAQNEALLEVRGAVASMVEAWMELSDA